MIKAVITGTGVYVPPNKISNEELVQSFNTYVREYNKTHADEIAAGTVPAALESSAEFIVKASGVESRYVMEKAGILDPAIMCPQNLERETEAISIQAEMCVAAAKDAMARAGVTAEDIDLVICSCANLQRAYPAIAIEVQDLLGATGFAFDMNAACSSATYGLKAARDAILSGSAKTVLMVNPEICTGQMNFRDRESHFIFGDACSAVIIQNAEVAKAKRQFEIKDVQLVSKFSNNIRNNGGFLNRTTKMSEHAKDKLFVQQGRRVYKDVVPMVSAFILAQLGQNKLTPGDMKRFWLHQANAHMNTAILERILGEAAAEGVAPIILNEFANTSSAGSIIAFHRNNEDLGSGDFGVLCSFGAGYTVGSVILQCHIKA